MIKNWDFYSKIKIPILISHTGYFKYVGFSFYITIVQNIELLGILSRECFRETSRKKW